MQDDGIEAALEAGVSVAFNLTGSLFVNLTGSLFVAQRFVTVRVRVEP